MTAAETDPAAPTGPAGGAEEPASAPVTAISVPDTGHPAAGEASPPPAPRDLSARLTSLQRLVEIGTDRAVAGGFSLELLADANALLARSGERLRLSGRHTVVALAGGTGSGKSALFNAIAGVDLSPVGVTRPLTLAAHACVWGVAGTAPLLDWLGIEDRFRYAQASVLDQHGSALDGLVMLDLPDHDSVMATRYTDVDRLIGAADLLVWVLDPQKYADAAVHRGYLTPMAGHGAVTIVVLNQADKLTAEEIEECTGDLRRLLESEGMVEPRIVVTSARTGYGIPELRQALTETVAERRAARDRIAADVDVLARRFAPYARLDEPAVTMSPSRVASLTEALAIASGVRAVGQSLESAYGLRAGEYVGWPVPRIVAQMRRDPLSRMRLGALREELRMAIGGPVGTQQAEVDNALTALTDEIAAALPDPWPAMVREAARSRADAVPQAVHEALEQILRTGDRVPTWWRAIRGWQWFLIGVVGVLAFWALLLTTFGVFKIAQPGSALVADPALLPWVGMLILATLLLGWLTAVGCRNVVILAADRDRDRMERLMLDRVAGVAREKIIGPIETELWEYARFREELTAASR